MSKPRYVPLSKRGMPGRVKPRPKLYTYRCAVDGTEYGYERPVWGQPGHACHDLIPWPGSMEVAYRLVRAAYHDGVTDLDRWVEDVSIQSVLDSAPYYLQDYTERRLPNRDELRQALIYARAWGTLRPLPEVPDITKRTDLQHTGFNYGRKRK